MYIYCLPRLAHHSLFLKPKTKRVKEQSIEVCLHKNRYNCNCVFACVPDAQYVTSEMKTIIADISHRVSPNNKEEGGGGGLGCPRAETVTSPDELQYIFLRPRRT